MKLALCVLCGALVGFVAGRAMSDPPVAQQADGASCEAENAALKERVDAMGQTVDALVERTNDLRRDLDSLPSSTEQEVQSTGVGLDRESYNVKRDQIVADLEVNPDRAIAELRNYVASVAKVDPEAARNHLAATLHWALKGSPGPPSPGVMRALRSFASDPNPAYRVNAAGLLAEVGERAPVEEVVAGLLKQADAGAITAAVEESRRIGTADALPVIARALDSEDPVVRAIGADALNSTNSPEAMAIARQLMESDEDALVRESAFQSWRGLDSKLNPTVVTVQPQ